MSSDAAHGQADVEPVLLEALADGTVRTTGEIIRAVKSKLMLRPADVVRARKREQESRIDQIVANALQDGRRLCRDGLIERVSVGAFRITAAGKVYRNQQAALIEQGFVTLETMFPNANWD